MKVGGEILEGVRFTFHGLQEQRGQFLGQSPSLNRNQGISIIEAQKFPALRSAQHYEEIQMPTLLLRSVTPFFNQ